MANIPTTVWQPKDGKGEYSLITPIAIVDQNGVALVDPTDSSIAIVSPDTDFTAIEDTIWTEDEST